MTKTLNEVMEVYDYWKRWTNEEENKEETKYYLGRHRPNGQV